MVAALHSFTNSTRLRCGVLVHLGFQNDVITSWLRLRATSNCFPIHIRHIQSVWAHWYAVHWHLVAALHSYTHPTCLIFWGSESLVESKWCQYIMVEADSHLELLPPATLDIYKVFEPNDMLSTNIEQQPCTVIYPSSTWLQCLGFWVTCGVKMMSLRQGWGWQLPQTAVHIHIRHTQSVWAYWYAVHWHIANALHNYTAHSTLLRFWGSELLVESKRFHYIQVEVEGHLILLLLSTLDIYKVFDHIDILSISIQQQPYTVILTLLGWDFGVLGHLWSQSDVITSWLSRRVTTNCFLQPH
jgi:hypothetical protein